MNCPCHPVIWAVRANSYLGCHGNQYNLRAVTEPRERLPGCHGSKYEPSAVTESAAVNGISPTVVTARRRCASGVTTQSRGKAVTANSTT